MNQLSVSPLGRTIAVVLFLLPSCSKVREYIEQHPSDIGKYCRVKSFNYFSSDLDYASFQHFSVSYNRAGNPVEMVQSLTDSMEFEQYSPDLHFRYDNKDRLSDVLFTDPGQTFVWTWDHYTYPSPHMIIDSIFGYTGNISDGIPRGPNVFAQIKIIYLDQQDRPVHIHEYTMPASENITDTYKTYDQRGNEVVPGVQFDDKINVYQTNRVWQLYFLEYSRNNPITTAQIVGGGTARSPASYNAYGLPTRFLGMGHGLFRLVFSEMNIQYSCDVDGPSVGK